MTADSLWHVLLREAMPCRMVIFYSSSSLRSVVSVRSEATYSSFCALLILVHHIWLLLFLAPVLFFLCKVKASRWQKTPWQWAQSQRHKCMFFGSTERPGIRFPNTVIISAQKWRQPSTLCSCVTKWVFHHFSLKLFAAALPLLTFEKHVKINKQNPGNNIFRC